MRELPRLRRLLRRLLYEPETIDTYYGVHDPSLLTMGRHSYGRAQVIAYEGSNGRVTIGAFCSIAAGVRFLVGGNHHIDLIASSPMHTLGVDADPRHNWTRGDIVVGSDVWIGRDATILSGVTIGDGAVIGACAVVARDVEPYAVVVGNPAREVKRRFSEADVETLLALRWWDWPDEKVVAARDDLRSADVCALVTRWALDAPAVDPVVGRVLSVRERE